MPRPKKQQKIEVFWQALTSDQLLNSDLTVRLRTVGASPEVQAVVTVLTNERPSALGERDASFILGYEACLRKLQELFQASPPENREVIPDPNYSTPEIMEELSWQTKS